MLNTNRKAAAIDPYVTQIILCVLTPHSMQPRERIIEEAEGHFDAGQNLNYLSSRLQSLLQH
ncbi:hypothetical protein BN873_490062 [Candidatus Competibacter denitrificans Run_A_D11]|uniref:Uncharacterized protein n=1 Tax=Candidatus Competibacter denitrificans Run_A_D11 TaxID=1400863 RepID=W6MDU1_9GAMM|nr:hypothetical protein BN873_490062 [Candidatus Competibacter denitrificans Run_A_D11]